MRFISIVVVVVFFVAGCSKKEKKDIIPANTFKEILVDLHLADGLYMTNYGKYQSLHNDSVNFYNTIFESYGYNRAIFDSTLKYYTHNPVKFDEIYQKVVNELDLLEQQFTQLRNFESDSSSNLFKGKTRIYLPKDSKATRIPFDITITKDSASYEINVFARKFTDDQSENLRITAYFWYTDSVTKEWTKSDFPEVSYTAGKYYNLYKSKLTFNSKCAGRLRGWILNHDQQKLPFNKHIDIKMIYIEKKNLARIFKVK